MSRCDDKRITRKVVAEAGLNVPRGRTARRDGSDVELLHEIGELVVKPARGEQGQGITVGVTTEPELEDAIELAGRSEEHTSELQSLMRTSYADFCLKKK